MAVTATVHFKMPQMRESGISSKLNLLNRMALAAVFGDRKGSFTVMAEAAGLSLLHLCHGVASALDAGCKDFVMAVITFVDADMKRMAEFNFSGIGQVKNHTFGTAVTSVAAACDTEGNICIMAGAAGSILLHVSHGESAAPLAAGKYTAVAISADIHPFHRISMYLVTEECRDLPETDIG